MSLKALEERFYTFILNDFAHVQRDVAGLKVMSRIILGALAAILGAVVGILLK